MSEIDNALEAREKFVTAINDTMLKIWQEQITCLVSSILATC